jgi:hypothetical protein
MTLNFWQSWQAQRSADSTTESLKPILLEQLRLVDKATTIAASHDVMAYQGIQAMEHAVVGYDGDTYDPSDEAEFRREAAKLGLNAEEITSEQREQLQSIFE